MDRTRLHARFALAAIAVLIICFMMQAYANLLANSQTYDEAVHLAAGQQYLDRRNFQFNREHPPLTKLLSALPAYMSYSRALTVNEQTGADQWNAGRQYLYGSGIPADRLLTLGRLPNLILGVFIILIAARWSWQLWGPGGAAFSAGLLSFDPNLIAHSCVATTDVGTTLFYLVTLYSLWLYLRSPTWYRLAITGISLGAALVSKFSMIILVPTIGVILGCVAFLGPQTVLPTAAACKWTGRLAHVIACSLGLLFVAELTVWACYLGSDATIWLDGFIDQVQHQSAGHPAFLLGNYSTTGWVHYFLIAFLVKTPLGTLAASLLALIYARKIAHIDFNFILIFSISVLAFMTVACLSRVNLGIRYLLPCYVLLFVAVGLLAKLQNIRPWQRSALCGLLVTATAVSSLSVAPHQLAFFNRAVGGPLEGHRYLSDSNLDWGQDLKTLSKWLVERGKPTIYFSYFGTAPPEYYGIRRQYLPGFGNAPSNSDHLVPVDSAPELLAVSVFSLQGVSFADQKLYDWLQDRDPIARAGYSILIYDITNDSAAHRKLAEVYAKTGFHQLARYEETKVRDGG